MFKNNFSFDSGNSGELVAVEGATMQGNAVQFNRANYNFNGRSMVTANMKWS